MIKLRKLFEDVVSGTFQMYHGGNRWETSPEIIANYSPVNPSGNITWMLPQIV